LCGADSRRAIQREQHGAQNQEEVIFMSARVRLFAASLLFLVFSTSPAATFPPGFSESLVASGISSPTAMAFAPDGRLFVCQQGGQLRIIKNGVLLATPFLTVTVDPSGERGLLGVTFDPGFANNGWVYVYYTATTPAVHNRISRFTATGDVVVPGSEVVILDLNNLNASNHNGGAIHFGPDGKLYAAVGENAVRANAQTLGNLLGKILRINADGTIPADNPFNGVATGVNRAIWALGLRNPYTFAFQPGTGRMFINDVGEISWEEINEGVRGANYGWGDCEGACNPPNTNFRDPIYQYSHSQGCAIVGGAFYNPAVNQFPPEYTGVYFFADLCGAWIGILDPANGNDVSTFATGLNRPVDLSVGADGALYYLDRGASSVYRVRFNSTPSMVTLTFTTVPPGLQLTVGQQTITAPFSVQSAVGSIRAISAPNQRVNKVNYSFVSWSDGGAQTHNIVTPSGNTTYTATFRQKGRR
jgi:glucose/arabinose dehydrogenase